jgi:hypothetical protein
LSQQRTLRVSRRLKKSESILTGIKAHTATFAVTILLLLFMGVFTGQYGVLAYLGAFVLLGIPISLLAGLSYQAGVKFPDEEPISDLPPAGVPTWSSEIRLQGYPPIFNVAN